MAIMFKSKKDKERLLEKARRMEEYASMIVDCIEDSDDEEYDETEYKKSKNTETLRGRYGYGHKMTNRWEE